MLSQEVSKMPISLSTPTRMSLMTSGGMRRERISDRASDLMFPTARFASSTKGWRAAMVISGERYSYLRYKHHSSMEVGDDSCCACFWYHKEYYTEHTIDQRTYLDFLQFLINFGFSFFNFGHLLRHLSFNPFHLCLLVTGILDNQKDHVMLIMFDEWNSLKGFKFRNRIVNLV